MAYRQTVDLTNITALPPEGTTGTTTIQVPAGARLHDIMVEVQQGQAGSLTTSAPATRAQIIAAIKRVKLKIGTVLMREFTAEELYTMLDMEGEENVDGILPIYFSNPKCATVYGEEMTSWDLHNTAIPLEIELEIARPAAGTYFNVKAKASVDNLVNMMNGQSTQTFVKYERWTHTIHAGEDSYFGLKKGRWNRLWIFGLGDATRVRLKHNGVTIYDRHNVADRNEVKGELAKWGSTMPEGVFPLILNANRQLTDTIAVAATDTLELITDVPAEANVIFIQEMQSQTI